MHIAYYVTRASGKDSPTNLAELTRSARAIISERRRRTLERGRDRDDKLMRLMLKWTSTKSRSIRGTRVLLFIRHLNNADRETFRESNYKNQITARDSDASVRNWPDIFLIIAFGADFGRYLRLEVSLLFFVSDVCTYASQARSYQRRENADSRVRAIWNLCGRLSRARNNRRDSLLQTAHFTDSVLFQ